MKTQRIESMLSVRTDRQQLAWAMRSLLMAPRFRVWLFGGVFDGRRSESPGWRC